MKQSSFFRLGWSDLGKGLITAAFGSVLAVIYTATQAGNFTIDWTAVWHGAATAAIAYLSKNFLTNSDDQFLSKEQK